MAIHRVLLDFFALIVVHIGEATHSMHFRCRIVPGLHPEKIGACATFVGAAVSSYSTRCKTWLTWQGKLSCETSKSQITEG
jgi:hypothetical protein